MASNSDQPSASASATPLGETARAEASAEPPSSTTITSDRSAASTSTTPAAPASISAASSTPAATPPPGTVSPRPASTSSQQLPQPAPSTQQTTSSIPTSSTPASMLPRSTAVVSAGAATPSSSSSAASSGSATPTLRAQAPANPPHSMSPRRASSSLAQGAPSFQSARDAHTAGRRIRQHNLTSPASTMASTDGTNAVPSMFGFYSHDGYASARAGSPASANGPRPLHGRNQPAWIRPARPNQSTGMGSRDPMLNSPLNWYASGPPRDPWNAVSAASAASITSHRSPPPHQSPAAQFAVTSASTDSSLLGAPLPSAPPTFEETTTISFTWTIRDLHLLREEVELSPPPSEGGRSVSAGAGKSDVWTSQPVFGDGKWKIEMVRTTRRLCTSDTETEPEPRAGPVDNDMSASAGSIDQEPASDASTRPEAKQPRNSITILSVYLTALVLDYTHANVEIPACIMVALRPVQAAVGRRGAENGGWMWRRFYDYTFQKEADLFTCHDLPSVSEMLQDVQVARQDSIALTIQLGLGPGHLRGPSVQLGEHAVARLPVEIEGHHLVPRAVLSSLHGLLDDANTGDVRILVRERGALLSEPSPGGALSDDGRDADKDAASNVGQVVPYPIGSAWPATSGDGSQADADDEAEDSDERIFVRDRVLWAHASVLKSRSDYFHTMLASDFSEGISHNYGGYADEDDTYGSGRKVRTLRIPDADFVTAYWFLRYLYTEDIEFADKEDVRSAVLDEDWAKGAELGYWAAEDREGSSEASGADGMLVDWTPVTQLKGLDGCEVDEAEMRGAPPRFGARADHRRDVSGSFVMHDAGLRSAASAGSSATTSGSLRERHSASGLASRAGAGKSAGTFSTPASPSGGTSAAGGAATSGMGAEGERRAGRWDRHAHPCAEPGAASALAIFRLAHRYSLESLSRLAAVHLVATLTPATAFPMLLATSMYAELHARIKTYVYQHWHLVAATHDFERCCDEVSLGMWGAHAGKTLRAFVKSLVSPLRPAHGAA